MSKKSNDFFNGFEDLFSEVGKIFTNMDLSDLETIFSGKPKETPKKETSIDNFSKTKEQVNNKPTKDETPTVNKNGYHTYDIPKGKPFTFEKIKEEFLELEDAVKQGDRVMTICELSDLILAIKQYAETELHVSLGDLIRFSQKTENSFKSGHR